MIIEKKIEYKGLSWLLEEPYAYAIPSIPLIDKIIVFVSRILYIGFRIFLRILLGKKKREKLEFYKKLKYNSKVSFSFYLFILFYKMIRFLKLGNPSLVKINVPKYGYKVFCPATKDDFHHMTVREEDILEKFCPKKGDIVIDVGAHLGRYALISSHRVGNEGKVIAIEANPQVLEGLKKNIKLNESTTTKNIISLNYAVYSEEKTKLNLFLSEESIDDVYSSL